MRAPGKGIDPRVMIGDMSNDAVSFAKERIELIKQLQSQLMSNYGHSDRSYHELRSNYLVLSAEWGVQAGVVSRYIGGVYVDRSFSNQTTNQQPLTAVPLATQKAAMKLLTEQVFAPNAMEVPKDLANYLQMQRRGFDFFSSGEDPKLHKRVLNIQTSVLTHILHPNTLQRITDSKLYGNQYELSDVFRDLTSAIFDTDLNSDVNTYRQNLQAEYVEFLVFIYQSGVYDAISKSKAHAQLLSIQKSLTAALPSSTKNSKEHRNFILSSIKSALDSN
jgi:hypothetical protein